MKKVAWFVFGSLCIAVSFYPMKYLLADEPVALLTSKSYELLQSIVYQTSFYAHITLGGVALLIGWMQFIKKLRVRYPKVHRMIGKIYVLAVLISGPFGFYIALHASGGLSPKLGLSIGAVIWTILTYLAYSTIRKGDVEAHKRFMTYSYAGTFGAVTLRLWMPILMMLTGDFTTAYGIVAWLSWLPNLAVVYLMFNHRDMLAFIYHKYHVKRVIIGMFLFGVGGLLTSFMSPQNWLYKGPSFEGTPIEKMASLSNSSFTKDKLDELENYLKDESETSSMMILENGKIIYEYGDVSQISYLASCRKSILAMLYGKYVMDGTIDLNETIGAMDVDEDDGLLPIEKQAIVDHIITARSGVFHLPANGGYDERNVKERGSVRPGTYFLYNNWDFNVAGHILELKSGNTVYEELEEQLAIPLGFEDWNIQNQSRTLNTDKSRYSVYHMHLSTRDMAKIGQLMLQNGWWNGEQVISKGWINKITSAVTPADTVSIRDNSDRSSPLQQSYGYMWWLFERFYDNPDFRGAYTASGHGGQYITVIPKRNVVVIHKTELDLLSVMGWSSRSQTPSWRYLWILRNLMLNRKSIASLAEGRSTQEVVDYIRANYQGETPYAISERLINEYGQELTDSSRCEEATQFFELNMELYPQGYYTHRTLDYYADCLVRLNRIGEAKIAFAKSLEYHPENQKTREALMKLEKG